VTVLTLGTFDLFHAGHVNLLRRCRELGSPVVVGLNSDAFVERYKGRPPVIGYTGRAAVVAACRYVDAVVANDQPNGSAWALIAELRPAAIVVGDDWADRDYLGQLGVEPRDLDDIGARVVFVPYTQGISSSAIRAALG
jgi:glycerol-3-phosphate cytidylyltransferase